MIIFIFTGAVGTWFRNRKNKEIPCIAGIRKNNFDRVYVSIDLLKTLEF